MAEKQSLLGSGWSRVAHNKRYIVWFYILNVTLAWFGAGAFNNQVHEVLDHSMRADRLVQGFDLGVLIEMFTRPEFGPTIASAAPAMHFAFLFFFLTVLFVPGVLQGYAAAYRLPREEFFRACGRNLWRFVRLLIVAALIMGAVAGALFGLHGLLQKSAAESTNELLLPAVRFAGFAVIFLIMTVLRIWFDLAQTDIVLTDQRAVRRSIAAGFRHTWRNLGRLVGNYLVITIFAAIILVAGILVWMKFVPPASVLGAAVVSQFTLLLLLIPRFWQRAVAVSYYLETMMEPVAVQSFTPPTVEPAVVNPLVDPVIPNVPPEPLGA
jgi:hypothetical protein